MPSYLVETYLPCCGAPDRNAFASRACSAARELTRDGTRVRFVGLIHVPADETCFFVFGAPSSADAERAAHIAALDPVRVVEAVTSGEE